jgi:hypothetical protein
MDATKRIRDICKLKKIKNVDLVNAGCGSPQTVSFVMTGKQKPNIAFLEAFFKTFNEIDPREVFPSYTGSERIAESKLEYGYCKECLIKQGEINRLEKELRDRNKRIEELVAKCSELTEKVPKKDAGRKAG